MKIFFLFFLLSSIIFSQELIPSKDNSKLFTKIDQLMLDKKYKEVSTILLDLVQNTSNIAKPSLYLGIMLEEGLGFKPDCAKAGYFYILASKNKECEGFIKISNMYASGICMEKDLIKAKKFEQKFLKCSKF